MTKRKRIYGDGPRVGRDRSGPAPPRGRTGTAPPGPRPAPPRGRSTAPPGPKPAPDRTTPRAPTLAPKPKTSSVLERAAGEGAITDAEGLERAYAQGDAYTHGKTTYVAGSHSLTDWWDDVSKIPFWGDSHKIYRMQMAQKAVSYTHLTLPTKA